MSTVLESIRGEYVRYKALAEGAVAQLSDAELTVPGAGGANSIAVIAWHISGNLRSRFTDFLTTDGEKSWRRRDEEFEERALTRDELLTHWERGWSVLFAALDALSEEQLTATVAIRGQAFLVHEALHRSLAHIAYHVGQIVYIARGLRGADWRWLSVPPGQSDAYNANPAIERGADHAAQVTRPKQ